MQPILNFVSNVGYVGVCVLGSYLALRNAVQVGDIQAFIQYVRNFTQPITQTANRPISCSPPWRRQSGCLNSWMKRKRCLRANITKKLTPSMVKWNLITSCSDTMRIAPSSRTSMPSLSQSNAWPSSAQPARARPPWSQPVDALYDVNAGAIRIDGVDVRDMKRDDLRDMFGMVLQDTWLFNGTIRENIRYGRLDATDEEVLDAARAAQVDHFCAPCLRGMTSCSMREASNISQGQKQLLTIARAIVSQPSILILDEATSSVDTRTEVLIQRAMDNLMRGRTSFIIAHRPSTIRDADLILVLRDGNIVEQGKHEGGRWRRMGSPRAVVPEPV